jgi:hypothetical protein
MKTFFQRCCAEIQEKTYPQVHEAKIRKKLLAVNRRQLYC